MSQFRKFAIALIALSAIAGSTIAANGIEVLGIEVLGIEVLSPDAYIAHTHITNAPADAMVFGVWNDGIQDHIVSAAPVNPNGLTPVFFPMHSPANKVVVGYMTDNGIEVLAFSDSNPYEGIWIVD